MMVMVMVVVTVVENPLVNQVVFEGNSALSEDKLTEEVTIKPRGIYTRAKVQEDVGAIVVTLVDLPDVGRDVVERLLTEPDERRTLEP